MADVPLDDVLVEFEEEEPEQDVCEECGDPVAYPYYGDDDGFFILLCDDCAHRICDRCKGRIEERPVPIWNDEIMMELWLCPECAAAEGAA